MSVMFPILIIAIGIAVLALGKRVAVLGAAVGAIVGVALLSIFPTLLENPLVALLIPGGLALLGFFAAAFAKGMVRIVLLVFGALAGAAVVAAFLNLFSPDLGWLGFLLEFVGGVVGFMLIRRYREWGLIILSGFIGALLVTRGLIGLMPALDGTLRGIAIIVLAGGSIGYQGGFLNRGKSTEVAKTTDPPPPAAPPPAAPPPAAPPPTE